MDKVHTWYFEVIGWPWFGVNAPLEHQIYKILRIIIKKIWPIWNQDTFNWIEGEMVGEWSIYIKKKLG